MQKRNGLQIVLSMCFTLLICLPFALLLVQGEEAAEYGETTYARPTLTLEGWKAGVFQSEFESWISHSYPGRRVVLRGYTALESGEANASRLLGGASHTQVMGNEAEKAVIEAIAEEQASYKPPRFPEYVRDIPEAESQSPFQGTDAIVVGKDGVLFGNGYINELFGFSPKYTGVTDDALQMRADQLSYMQKALEERGIAFTVLFTPNKAAYYPEYIPEWYLDRYTMPEEYVRPYTRFRSMLEAAGVHHIDSGAVFAAQGMTASFPMTGIHWNKTASMAVAQAVVRAYMEQTGTVVPNFKITGVEKMPGVYEADSKPTREQDAFDVLYSGRPMELPRAIVDPYYVTPEYEIENPESPPIQGMWLQGGSFTDELRDQFKWSGIVDNFSNNIYLNDPFENWNVLLSSVSYVVLEINEQYVYGMGGSVPAFGEGDFVIPIREVENVYDSLYTYLLTGETDEVIVGEDNMLFETSTINELYGFSKRYTDVTDAYLEEKAAQFAVIQAALRARGIPFAVLFTPSKASRYAQDIPASYLEENTAPQDYVRPYDRFKQILDARSVFYLDSAAILDGAGIQESFPQQARSGTW